MESEGGDTPASTTNTTKPRCGPPAPGKHAQLFEPPLPAEQAALLSPRSKFAMGNLTHVVLQFPSVWWDDTLRKWLSANKGANRSAAGGPDGGGAAAAGEFAVWHNLNHGSLLPGSQTLVTFLGDPQPLPGAPCARGELLDYARTLKNTNTDSWREL